MSELENSLDELMSVAEARQKMLRAFSALTPEFVELDQAYGRVLAEAVRAIHDFPHFDNSSMDGFAVRHEDTTAASPSAPVSLTVISDIPAGTVSSLTLGHGQAMRIMTGAPMPAGADGVVPVEETILPESYTGNSMGYPVRITKAVHAGENVRARGGDVHAGEVVLEAGRWLKAHDVGLIAMLGWREVTVHRRPVIAVLSTGDELIPPGSAWSPGKIYESNIYMVGTMVEKYGGKLVSLGIAPDQPEAVKSALDRAVEQQVDLILSTAGVSVGEFDYVRRVVEAYGSLEFWRVNMRPGKPLAFGWYRGVPFAGLPGNPVSAFTGFEVFVRPAILKMLGVRGLQRKTIRVKTLERIVSDGRESYVRAIVEPEADEWTARVIPNQGSGNLRSLVQANALLLVPSGVKSLPIGALVDAWLLDEI